MQIFIPSSGRASRQITLAQIPDAWLFKTTVVVPFKEYPTYYNALQPWTTEGAVVRSCADTGIGPTRQWIVDHSDDPHVLMLDDDLTFFERRNDDRTKFADANNSVIDMMLNDVVNGLDSYAHVGICTREGGNRLPDPHYFNTRTLRALAYDTAVLKKHDIRFDAMNVMEDFYVSLSLLTAGYDNLLLSDWVHDQVGSNTSGGCSQYRTSAVQMRAAHELEAAFPDFVKVVKKKTKVAWGGQERYDVRIQWKKARASYANT